MFAINHTLTVNAPTETVWKVISDLDAYGEWNPFVVACDSTLEVNSPIKMQVKLVPFFAFPQKETIYSHDPSHQLSYGIRLPFNALSSVRCHQVKTLTPGVTEYTSTFELSGWLSPLVQWMLQSRLKKGFDGMAEGLQLRSESFS